MGWLNTLLDVGIIGMQVSQASKLDALKQQHADAAVIQAVVQALRSEIFNIKKAAEKALQLEAVDLPSAATAMLLVKHRYDEMGVSPDIFPEIADKEYASQTQNLVYGESQRLLTQLEPAVAQHVLADTDAIIQLPRYEYFLDHYDDVQTYRQAQSEVKRLSTLNNGCVMVILFFVAFWAVASVCIAFAAIAQSEIVGSLSCIGAIAILVGLVVAYLRYSESSTYSQAKTTIQKLEKKGINFDLYGELEHEFGNDVSAVRAMRDVAEARVGDIESRGNAFGAQLTG